MAGAVRSSSCVRTAQPCASTAVVYTVVMFAAAIAAVIADGEADLPTTRAAACTLRAKLAELILWASLRHRVMAVVGKMITKLSDGQCPVGVWADGKSSALGRLACGPVMFADPRVRCCPRAAATSAAGCEVCPTGTNGRRKGRPHACGALWARRDRAAWRLRRGLLRLRRGPRGGAEDRAPNGTFSYTACHCHGCSVGTFGGAAGRRAWPDLMRARKET